MTKRFQLVHFFFGKSIGASLFALLFYYMFHSNLSFLFFLNFFVLYIINDNEIIGFNYPEEKDIKL